MEHIFFDNAKMELRLLDQRRLPEEEETFVCSTYKDVIEALKKMVVRGAPAIGVTAAYGCVLAAHALGADAKWRSALEKALDELETARPTAVNLQWAVHHMRQAISPDIDDPRRIVQILLDRAKALHAEDVRICRQLGHIGAQLINNGDTILTHCNAGALATGGYGTALGVIRAAVESGKSVNVIADETRPFLQGSRLTAWELARDGIPVTVACDNACALLMQKGKINLVVVGADRVAANGDTANKIGTLGVAVLARYFHVPFYVASPLSTIDPKLSDGSQIPIEERPDEEVRYFGKRRICPDTVPVLNFAFDVTPAQLIDGIITEAGLLRPPYPAALTMVLAEYEHRQNP